MRSKWLLLLFAGAGIAVAVGCSAPSVGESPKLRDTPKTDTDGTDGTDDAKPGDTALEPKMNQAPASAGGDGDAGDRTSDAGADMPPTSADDASAAPPATPTPPPTIQKCCGKCNAWKIPHHVPVNGGSCKAAVDAACKLKDRGGVESFTTNLDCPEI